MNDTITLPRSVVEQVREALDVSISLNERSSHFPKIRDAYTPLTAAIEAAKEREAEPNGITYEIDLPHGLHQETKLLIVDFAEAMAKKLAHAQRKYGYSDGWMRNDWIDECREKLIEHLAKGDPRDVANYCAFLWHHHEKTVAPKQEREAEQDATAQAHRLALELECLLLSCDDNAAVSKWWDSAHEALAQWKEFRETEPVAAEKHGCHGGKGATLPQHDQIKTAVDRFLGWKLPENFAPDCHITFDAISAIQTPNSWPIGTNLLTADQAKAMFEYCLEGTTAKERETEPVARVLRTRIAWIRAEDPQEHEFGMMLYNRPQPQVPEWQPTDEELTAIYMEANGIEGKNPPITTQRIFTAMRAMLAAAPKKEG